MIHKGELTDLENDELNRLNQDIYQMPIGETKAEIDAMDILRDFANKMEDSKKKIYHD